MVIIPALARKLADRLEAWQGLPPTPQELPVEITAAGLADKYEIISVSQWRAAMGLISLDGIRVPLALQRAQIVPWVFRRYLRADSRLHVAFVRHKRYSRRFPMLVVDDMLEELARTSAPFKQIVLAHGYSLTAYKRLVDLVWRTPAHKEAYLAARRARVMRGRAQLMSVPDDELVLMGRREISRQAFRIHSLRPMPDRRAEAARYRSERAAKAGPAATALHEARRRAKRRGG